MNKLYILLCLIFFAISLVLMMNNNLLLGFVFIGLGFSMLLIFFLKDIQDKRK